jgi:ribosomal protein S2
MNILYSKLQLINSNIYIGGWYKKRHISMSCFIVGVRDFFSIFNLDYISLNIQFVCRIVKNIMSRNGLILLHINKLPEIKQSLIKGIGSNVWNCDWAGGLLTNYKEIRIRQRRDLFDFPNYVMNFTNLNYLTYECSRSKIWHTSLCNVDTNMLLYWGLGISANNENIHSIRFFILILLKIILRINILKKFLYLKKILFLKRNKVRRKNCK